MSELDDRQKKTLEEFASTLAKCQSVTYVAVMKDGDKPATYHTGGFKGEGSSFLDIAKSLGVVCAEMAQAMVQVSRNDGKRLGWDDAINMIFEFVGDGTEMARAVRGERLIHERGDAPAPGGIGPESAPRGF
jgi:hypothetical protein